MRMTKLMFSCVFGSLVVSASALAQPKTADEWFKEGANEYNLGNFDKAVDDFKQAFSLETVDSKKPAYLYNIAQAYREEGKCKDAAFFYNRFLALKENDKVKPLSEKTRQQTEALVAQMEECAKTQGGGTTTTTGTGTGTGTTTTKTGTGTTKTGTGTSTGTSTSKVASHEGEEGGEEGEGGVSATVSVEPKLVSARLVAGAAKIGAGDLSVPIQGTVGLIAGYPIPISPELRVDVGLALMVTPVGIKNSFTMAASTATFTTALANAGATYTVAPKIGVRGDLGAGVLVLGGVSDMGNPFTQNGVGTSGALVMPAVRIGASVDYEITPNIIGTATPFAFTYAPAKSGLRSDIGGFTRIDFMVGIGYRM